MQMTRISISGRENSCQRVLSLTMAFMIARSFLVREFSYFRGFFFLYKCSWNSLINRVTPYGWKGIKQAYSAMRWASVASVLASPSETRGRPLLLVGLTTDIGEFWEDETTTKSLSYPPLLSLIKEGFIFWRTKRSFSIPSPVLGNVVDFFEP